MKVRVYSPFFPYPPTEGAYWVILEQLRSLRALGAEVELVFWRGESRLMPVRAEVTHIGGEKLREPRLQRLGRIASTLFSSSASTEAFHYPIKYASHRFEPADLGIYHYSFAYNWIARGQRPERRVVVHYHNLESELAQARLTANPLGNALHRLNSRKMAAHERALAERVDEIWFLSPVDRATFGKSTGRAQIRLVPPSFSPELAKTLMARFAQQDIRKDSPAVLGFVGGLDFAPNRDSFNWLLDKVAPLLASDGFGGELRVVGRSAPEWLLAKARQFPFVKMLGYVADLEPFWAQLSHSATPHVSGSGVRIKLAESLVSGIPSLATTEACARLSPGLQSHPLLLGSDNPRAWADRLLAPNPFEQRLAFHGQDAVLDWKGEEIYRFLMEWARGPWNA